MMALGASMDVLGGVVTRAASSVPGRARVGGVLDGVMARATLLDIHGCMHACIWAGAVQQRGRVGCLALRCSTIIKASMN